MKEKYKLSEIADKRLEESNLKIDQDNSKLSRIGEMALYSTLPNEEHKDLINSFKNQQVNRHALDEFLLAQELINNDLYRNVVNGNEQVFIDAVSSLSNKEQDKGMEM